jgi:dephospho-CoA kinase
MLVLGLTGSAAMGKSTVAAMFAEAGCAVFDADRTVHDLYRGDAAPLIEAAFPGVVVEGAVDRAKLGERVFGDQQAFARLEAIVHPLVRAAEIAFRAKSAASGRRIAILDIPLLFETGGESRVDAVVVVSAAAAAQRRRLLDRAGADEARVAAMLARQMPDADKRARAHFIVDTNGSLDDTRHAVADVLRAVAGMAGGR